VCGLIFYAVGIATNFFASPAFSMFWIISYQTAHNVVTYVVVVIAVALSMVLSIGLIKKRKAMFPETHNKMVIRAINARDEVPVRAIPSTDNQKTASNPESNKTEQKGNAYTLLIVSNESTNGAVADNLARMRAKQSTTQISTQQNADNNSTIDQATGIKVIKNEDKITCQVCKKEFSTPLFSLDFSSSNPKLIRLCPYCNQPLDSEPKNTA
jgi:uncharacterized Zn-finger protein